MRGAVTKQVRDLRLKRLLRRRVGLLADWLVLGALSERGKLTLSLREMFGRPPAASGGGLLAAVSWRRFPGQGGCLTGAVS